MGLEIPSDDFLGGEVWILAEAEAPRLVGAGDGDCVFNLELDLLGDGEVETT